MIYTIVSSLIWLRDGIVWGMKGLNNGNIYTNILKGAGEQETMSLGFDPETSSIYTKVLTTGISCILCYYHKVLY